MVRILVGAAIMLRRMLDPACVHAYMHTYMHTCIHTYIHTYIHTADSQKQLRGARAQAGAEAIRCGRGLFLYLYHVRELAEDSCTSGT